MKIHGTAKAGALSKKDFGVAFGKSTPESELLWENDNADEVAYNFQYSQAMRFDDPDSGEENTDVIGKVITSIKIGLKKVGDPSTTTVSGRYWFSDGASPPEANDPDSPDINSDSPSLDKDDLTTSFVMYEFVFDGNTRTVVAGDAVGIQFSAITTDSSNAIFMQKYNSAVDDSYLGVGDTTSWNWAGGRDRSFKFEVYGYEP